ncbi:mobile element protein [Microcystis aeruginosa NIES-44]|uniref:Mobile element protein n=1 Tax=Microcystis aeruginosa NIES-44 TaxID=449439 RepID=A0A0A1W1A3_MICAE|nr:mobile element protein [Microcystis aeruginosa NIES-44]
MWPPNPPRHRGGWVWGVGFYRFSGRSAKLSRVDGELVEPPWSITSFSMVIDFAWVLKKVGLKYKGQI